MSRICGGSGLAGGAGDGDGGGLHEDLHSALSFREREALQSLKYIALKSNQTKFKIDSK